MAKKPAYEELRQEVKELKKEATNGKRAEERTQRLNRLKEDLLASGSLNKKLKRITDCVVETFDADFCRIWITKPGDLCDSGCFHANVTEGPHACRYRDRCLHLMASSGRYTHIDGGHWRVPFGCYKIGHVASGDDPKFITNDVTHDPQVHDHDWARRLGLVAFVGYRLLSADGTPIGVLALFSKYTIFPDEDTLLEGLANTTAQVVQTTKAEEALRDSEERYRTIFELAADSIVLIDGETGEFVEFNERALDNLGFSREEFKKLKIPDFEVIESAEEVTKHIKKIIKEGSDSFETKHRTKGGEIRNVEVRSRSLSIRGKNFVQSIWRDITDRKRAEEQMKASLREKEVLLREIHHRVKNNFQIISSLLDMTKMRTRNQEAIDLLTDARSKIYTMALVHTQLYEQGRFDRVNMGGHIRKLVDYLSHTYGGRGKSIHTMIEPSDVYLTLNQAIPCALVLSEIISNAFKHAFAETQKGTIEISAQRSADNTIFISVEDDGMGIPEEIDIYKANSLGLKLIRNIVEEQLMGKVRVERSKGTNISIEFKALEEKARHV